MIFVALLLICHLFPKCILPVERNAKVYSEKLFRRRELNLEMRSENIENIFCSRYPEEVFQVRFVSKLSR